MTPTCFSSKVIGTGFPLAGEHRCCLCVPRRAGSAPPRYLHQQQQCQLVAVCSAARSEHFQQLLHAAFPGVKRMWSTLEDQVYGWSFDNAVGLSASWNIFDGGRARPVPQNKQRAEESRFNFATQRNTIRREVEASFCELRESQQNIRTTARRCCRRLNRCAWPGCASRRCDHPARVVDNHATSPMRRCATPTLFLLQRKSRPVATSDWFGSVVLPCNRPSC